MQHWTEMGLFDLHMFLENLQYVIFGQLLSISILFPSSNDIMSLRFNESWIKMNQEKVFWWKKKSATEVQLHKFYTYYNFAEFSLASWVNLHSKLCQPSKMVLFTKIINGIQPLAFFTKNSILDIWEISKCASHKTSLKIDAFKFNFANDKNVEPLFLLELRAQINKINSRI